MSSSAQELHDLLPRRKWRPFKSINWENLLPAPSKQHTDVVPKKCGGTCALHTYSEALTAHLRRFAESNEFAVNLRNLIRLAWAKGFQRASGSSVTVIGRDFGQKYGIPIEGTLPDNIGGERLSDGDLTDYDCYVLGTTVHSYMSVPLPFSALTAEKADDAMEYREHLCDCLNIGPVVLSLELQEHYAAARKEGEPYQRRNIPTKPETDRLYHCVTAYGYDCPDETVRSLKLIYQENMKNAPEEEPRRGLYMDPDAFDKYYLPNVIGMRLSKSPADGYTSVHLSPPRSPSPSLASTTMLSTCTTPLAPSDDLLAKATSEAVKLLKNRDGKSEISGPNIQMICALSLSVGNQFGPHLAEAVPLLINYCTSASENEELREYSLQALESFMLRFPKDVSPHCEHILNLALEYVSYDPNFTDSMEEDTDDEVQDEEDDDGDEYTDDQDASCKVRRASAKCLSAIIVSRPQTLSKMYQEACAKLIDRFREREENVKMDIFNTFIELLRQTANVTKGQGDIDESSPRWLLKQEVPKIVKSINRQLREKSIKTKVGAFSVLKELVIVLPDCLADHFGSLVPGIEKALNDKSSTSNLKIEALAFTRIVMASHSPSVFHPYIQALSGPILSAIGDRYYKVTAEALRVCGELVRVLRPNFEARSIDFSPYVGPIYKAILARLANQDQDQEVKECAISCMSLVISTFGDGLQRELPSCLPILVDRMGNEITRLTAVKAFAVIASSPLRIDLKCVLDHVVSELTAFLRKANRALRQATLGTLNSLVVTYGGQIGSSSYETIIAELSTLISDIDLHMAALALELCSTIMVDRRSIQNVGLAVRQKVLPQALILIRSALLQGQALQALQKFFASLVQSANTSFETLLDSLISTAKPSQSGGLSKQALSSIAQCVAVLCLAAGDQKCASTIEMLKDILKDDSAANSAKQHMALLCLGEIGRRKDLSKHVQIENIVIESFQSPFEEIKSAASYALGNIAVGNLSKYLPFILDQIDNQQKKQYLLLHSLKEVIARQSVDHTGKSELQDSNIVKILALLFNHCESEEEGVRNVVAECLGKIALIEPNRLIPALKERTSSPAANTRATVAIAIKYSIVERPGKIDPIMYSEISTFLMLIKDSDRHVRRAAVLALSTAAHNKPNLIKALLPELLPLLYDQTVVKPELIRTVDLGPFKHVVDDGLELRKAAFECVDTLLDNCLDQVNPSSFIVPFLLSGLGDHYDVKMPCHLILSKLADKCPSAVLAVLDSLVEPIEKTISHKPKGDAVKQEIDRNEDMIRSALRAIAALSRISGSDYSMKLKNLMNKITSTPSLAEKYNSVRSE